MFFFMCAASNTRFLSFKSETITKFQNQTILTKKKSLEKKVKQKATLKVKKKVTLLTLEIKLKWEIK